MKAWYNLSWNDVTRELNSDFKYGLTEEKVEQSRKQFGDNKTLKITSKGFIRVFFFHLFKIYSILGIIISFLLFYFGELKMPSIILGIISLCSFLNAIKDYNNEKKLNYLAKITPKKALVIRNKSTYTINPEEIVVGDIVYLEKGDVVPADIRLIECENLIVKESAITGNIELVEKYETKIEDREISLSEMKNIVFKSSFIIEGMGKGIVISVGNNTQIGSITKDIMDNNLIVNIMEQKVSKIVNNFAIFYIIGAALISIYGYYLHKTLIEIIHLITLGYLIFVPIEIILSIGLISFVIKKSKTREGIYFEGLSSIQLLSEIDILILDKVGLLTEEKMVIRNFFTNGKILDFNSGDIEENKDNINRIMNIGLTSNDAKIDTQGNFVKGTIIEKALITEGFSLSINKKAIDIEQPLIFHIPYDIDKRIKTTVNKIEDKYRANSIGAVDKLLERCTHIMKNGIEVEITSKDISDIKEADLSLSMKSLHVVGFAYRNFNYEPSINENVESNLVFVGLIGFDNIEKEDAQECIKYCKSLAIKPVILTEDNKIAANAFGEKVKLLYKNDLVLSGVELDNMDEDEIEKFVEKVGIYSRVSSNNKFNIVENFKKLGYKPVVTGDRFTDLPSFKVAHMGVAIGRECTNIAKKLSDLYISDKNFFKILSLIEESRKIIISIKNIIKFNFIIAIIELLSMIVVNSISSHLRIDLGLLVLTNFITLTLSSLLIYFEHNNIRDYKYEEFKIDGSILKSYSTGMIIYIIFLMAEVWINFYFGSKREVILGEINVFTILNLNPIIFSMYFIEFKNLIKNKIATIILSVNVLVYIIVLTTVYFSQSISIGNILWDIRLVAISIILQFFLVGFIKELDKKS